LGCAGPTAALVCDPSREVAAPFCRASAPGAPSVAVVLAGPVEGVEVGGVRAAVVAVDPDEPVVVLVCGPPAATSPGASARVHLAGAAPAAVAAAVDDVRAPPELLSAISPGGLSGRR
jgi:hypothetical protein